MDERPTYISLFAGIGGLDLAVERAGFRCVGQVEWDKHATAVLERWWPGVPRWGDIHEFGAAAYAEREPDQLRGGRGQLGAAASREVGTVRNAAGDRGAPVVDLICGGFPCQPASTAGRRKGTADDRWLWPEFARVVGELGPRYVLVENVPGLTTVNGGRAFSEVLGTLADLGYDTTWRSVRASDVGAPHRRQRIFLLAHARDRDDTERAWSPRREEGERAPVGSELGNPAAHTNDGGQSTQLRPPSLTGIHEGQAGAEPARADRRVATDAGIGSLTGTGATGNGLPEPAQRGAFAWGAYEPAIRRWEAMTRPAPHPVDDKGRLAPAFVEWMMSFPAGWTDRMTRTQALKALGNAVVWPQAFAALSALSVSTSPTPKERG